MSAEDARAPIDLPVRSRPAIDCAEARTVLADDARQAPTPALQAHLERCSDCVRFAEEASELQSLARALPRAEQGIVAVARGAATRRRPSILSPIAAALAVIVLVGAAVLYGFGFGGPQGGADASPPRFAVANRDAAPASKSPTKTRSASERPAGGLLAALDRAQAVWAGAPQDGGLHGLSLSAADPLGESLDVKTSLVDLALAGRLDDLLADVAVNDSNTTNSNTKRK